MADSSDAGTPQLAAPGERGTLAIADKVVEKIASIAASEIEAVTDTRSGWAGIVRRALPRATTKVAGGRSRVAVDVSAAWPSSLTTLTTRVRDHVSERITALTGMAVVAVDVTVADVVHLQTKGRNLE